MIVFTTITTKCDEVTGSSFTVDRWAGRIVDKMALIYIYPSGQVVRKDVARQMQSESQDVRYGEDYNGAAQWWKLYTKLSF